MMNEDNSCVIRFRRTAEVLSGLKIWRKEKKQVVHKLIEKGFASYHRRLGT